MVNKKIETIVFDLDGTLVESHKTIYYATLATLDKLQINHSVNENKFNKLIGLHFIDIFIELNINVPDFDEFISIYKNLYFDFINHSSLYPNVEKVLNTLYARNYKIALLTTKGEDQAKLIIQHFKLEKYFNLIAGRVINKPIKPAPEPLLSILTFLKTPIENGLMVGDTEMDIQCGHNANVKSCAVTFGYRTHDQIEKEKPNFIINNLSELIVLLEEN